MTRSRFLQGGGRCGVLRDKETHWQHMRLEEAVALEKILRPQLRPVGQQRDPEKLLLLGEIDRVLEQLRSVAMTAERIVHHQVFQQNHKPALGRADREKKIDHPNDRAVASQDKNAAAIRLFEDEPESLELLLFVGPKILFLAEKFAGQIR